MLSSVVEEPKKVSKFGNLTVDVCWIKVVRNLRDEIWLMLDEEWTVGVLL